jgi:uncharacterized protein YbjQ (UPF0145 family)
MKTSKIAVLVVGLLAVVSLCACSTGTKKTGNRNYTSTESGKISTAQIAVKDYDVKGMIFVESKVTTDIAGQRNGSGITYEMLMKEAAKLGADDVINVRIDVVESDKHNDIYNKNQMTGDEIFAGRELTSREYIYKASALAIKYTKAIGVATDSSLEKVEAVRDIAPVATAIVADSAKKSNSSKSSSSTQKVSVFSGK